MTVQLQDGSWQIHHQGPQGERMRCTCVLTVRSLAAITTLGSGAAPGHRMAPSDVLTGRSVHARREVPVDHEARRQAAGAAAERRAPSSDGRCGERSAAAELCSKELRREDAPEAEAGRRRLQ